MQNRSTFRREIIFLAWLFISNVYASSKTDKRTSAFVSGDFIIGVLFPLHHQPLSNSQSISNLGIKCGEIRELYGIQPVEVALQTLDMINNDAKLLPSLTLGMEIRDECWYAPVALRESIELIKESITPETYLCSDEYSYVNRDRKRSLIGVIGPGSSSVALQVQNLLQLFQISQVGYSTTSRDLSDKSRFNYFLRVVPSDYYQAQVMLDVVKYFGWTYVSVVNTDENYGQSGIQAFRELAEKAGVCIARENSVLSNAADVVFDKVVLNLKQDPNAVVIVCFCEGFTVRGLLRATRRLNMTNNFLFIGSDGWADRRDVTQGFEEEALGGLSIRIHSPYVKSFDKYYLSLRPNTNHRNPWFKEFWESQFHCKLKNPEVNILYSNIYSDQIYSSENKFFYDSDGHDHKDYLNSTNITFCSGNEDLEANYRQDPKLSFVRKAIYSFGYALHNMHRDICGNNFLGICTKLLPFNRPLFKSYLMNVSFEWDAGIFEFDENGDPPGRYDIVNFNKFNGKFDYVQIGSWNNGSLIWTSNLKFPQLKGNNVTSVCSQECPTGYYQTEQGGKDKRCCWVCVPCSSEEILAENGKRCIKCQAGYEPNVNKTGCIQLPIVYVHWQDGSAIIVMTASILGFLTVVFTLIIFLHNNATPVVKSSTKELSYIILAGMALAHLSIFPMLGKPTDLNCAATRFLPGLSFSMIYSALLTKTNRIARILAGSKKSFPKKKPKFLSTAAQIFITIFLIFVEIFIAGTMLHLQLPETTQIYLVDSTLLECQISVEGIIVPYIFDIFLVLLCTIYAIITRNVPENFNEAKFIGFGMYTTCVIWIAFAPIYYGSGAKVITMSMCVTLSALVTWIFLFTPKLYIIILKPERNNRAFFTTTKIRCHIGSTPNSGILEKSSGSWKESSISVANIPIEKNIKNAVKKTVPIQTVKEPLLNPDSLLDDPIKKNLCSVRITESECCQKTNCQMKNITIILPQHQMII